MILALRDVRAARKRLAETKAAEGKRLARASETARQPVTRTEGGDAAPEGVEQAGERQCGKGKGE